MAKLITKHDPYHIHKTLGVMVLLHYMYRITLLLTTGNAFPPYEDPLTASISIALHGVLSYSSLLLPLPPKRNFNAPMIWPEFRLHSILFASRHILSSILTIHNIWPTNIVHRALAKTCLVVSTTLMAGKITEKYGCNEKRTTNAMPYPKWTTQKQQDIIKYRYAKVQFFATVSTMYNDATCNFFPMLAIQTAPLMMTLVRKGKCSSMWYHRIYALSLWMSFVAIAVRIVIGHEFESDLALFGVVCAKIVMMTRMKFRLAPWLLWSMCGIMLLMIYPLWIRPMVSDIVVFDMGYQTWIKIIAWHLVLPPLAQLYDCCVNDIQAPSFQKWPFLTLKKEWYIFFQ